MHDDSPASNKVKVIGKGRFLQLVDAGGWEFAERAKGDGVVAIVAVTDDNRLVLTEQFRPAVKANVIDLPAGLSGDTDQFDGEDLQSAAARELEEETGFVAQSWKELAIVSTLLGLTSETVTLFLAEQLQRTGDGGGDESESINVHLIPLDELPDWLERQSQDSRLIDPKVYTGLWLRDVVLTTKARRQ